MKSLLSLALLVCCCFSLKAQAVFSIGPYHEQIFVKQPDFLGMVPIENTFSNAAQGLQFRVFGSRNFSWQNRVMYRRHQYQNNHAYGWCEVVSTPGGSTASTMLRYSWHTVDISSLAMSSLLRYGIPIGRLEPFVNAGFDFQHQLLQSENGGDKHFPSSAQETSTLSGQFAAGANLRLTRRIDLDLEYLNRLRLFGNDDFFAARSWALAASLGFRFGA